MKTQTMLAAQRGTWKYAAAAAVSALVLGGVIGFATRESFLLADQEASTGIPPKETAYAQVLYAQFLENGNNPDAWNAVLLNYGDQEPWATHARQTLAMLYLQKDQYDLALPLFQQLADLPEVHREPKARGLAGQVVIFTIQNDPRLPDTIIALLKLAGDQLANILGQELSKQVREVFEKKLDQVEEPARGVMQKLLQQLDTGNPPPR